MDGKGGLTGFLDAERGRIFNVGSRSRTCARRKTEHGEKAAQRPRCWGPARARIGGPGRRTKGDIRWKCLAVPARETSAAKKRSDWYLALTQWRPADELGKHATPHASRDAGAEHSCVWLRAV